MEVFFFEEVEVETFAMFFFFFALSIEALPSLAFSQPFVRRSACCSPLKDGNDRALLVRQHQNERRRREEAGASPVKGHNQFSNRSISSSS